MPAASNGFGGAAKLGPVLVRGARCRPAALSASADRTTDSEVACVTSAFVDATDERRLIQAGSPYRFLGFDDDGDVLLSYKAAAKKTVSTVIFEDLHHLSLQ